MALVEKTLARWSPAGLAYAVGRADFAMNRREKTPTGFKIGLNPGGPTDKSVPILVVNDAQGSARAIVFGYACHNTTLTDKSMVLSGDYAGFAQATLEERYPRPSPLHHRLCGRCQPRAARYSRAGQGTRPRPGPGR